MEQIRIKKLTDRMNQFRETLLDTRQNVCSERALWTTKAYKEHEMDQIVLKRAYMLKEVLAHMSIYIEDETLLVGNQASSNRAAPIFPEYAMDWVIRELDDFDKRNGDRFYITEETKENLREIYPYWKGRTLQDKAYAAYPESAKLIYDLGIIRNEGNITSGDAHLAVDYEGLLKYGLNHYRHRTEEKLSSLDLTVFDDMKRSYFYQAILIVLDSVEQFAGRYAQLAEEKAASATPARAAELKEIARICRKVPMEPAASFQEALQSLWFVHLILQIESNGHSLSFGRFDQYCLPYYEMSRQDGMTCEAAEELLVNLWLKTMTINKVRSSGHSKFAAGSPMYQNVTIGGQTTDKKDAVNELSWLVLETVAATHLPQPNLSVRYFSRMSQPFMDACITVIKQGFGMPAFNNDEIIIPALMAQGVHEEDAYNYSAIGCVEVGVPGKWGYRCTGMSYLNFPKTLMTALNDGVDLNTGEKICTGTGHFLQMESFEDVLHAWDQAARQLIKQGVILDNCADMVVEQEVPDILCSTLVADCIQRGKHLKEGGAVYDMISQLQVGVANLGDSLAALKKNVYENQVISRKDLWDALVSDFQTPDGARIQKLLLDAPKYGNDDDYVDELVVKGYDTYLDEIKKYKNTRYKRGVIGGQYFPGTSSVAANIAQGASTPATPDGRRSGEPLAEGCSPQHAVDVNGPTSVFKSVSKLKTKEIAGGVLLNQKVSPSMLVEKEDCLKLSALLRTFFDVLKGYHVQYNVVSKETMLDAQVHPEKHKDLIVRVAGYSTFFNLLSTATQNDIIERTEQNF
ncbi:MAG: glycyl radical protein [Lachnospiraceae bacterium]|nr:glycyl radical protein [Lachnospiraceae bacterium]